MYRPLPEQLTIKNSPIEGLNVCKGQVTYKAVAEDLQYEYVLPTEALN